jgi:hypothetical protein
VPLSERRQRFDVLPDVSLEVNGDDAALRHYAAEYGAPSTSSAGDGTAAVRVRIGHDRGDAPVPVGPSVLGGRHKTVAWYAVVSDPDAHPISATISLRGRPRWFALSLTQGYLVEPLLSVAASDAGGVLLPAAAIVTETGGVVLLGRSRSGKSSLSARAAAAGLAVLGDDQVLIGRAGWLTRFPRRLRVYDDLRATAPEAFRRLPAWARRALRVRVLARLATAGYVRPSLAIPASDLGAAMVAEAPMTRFLVLERTSAVTDIEVQQISAEAAMAAAESVLDDQRRHLRKLGDAWRERLRTLAGSENDVLASALGSVAPERILIPDQWPAAVSVDAVWDRIRR